MNLQNNVSSFEKKQHFGNLFHVFTGNTNNIKKIVTKKTMFAFLSKGCYSCL